MTKEKKAKEDFRQARDNSKISDTIFQKLINVGCKSNHDEKVLKKQRKI